MWGPATSRTARKFLAICSRETSTQDRKGGSTESIVARAAFRWLYSEIPLYTEIAMRALGTSVMALLVVAALFWGNCFSCPQVLLTASQHGCCHRTKAPKDDCKTQ